MPEKRMKLRKKPRLSVLGKGISPFHVLALSQKKIRFFSCDSRSITPVALDAKTPQNYSEDQRFVVVEQMRQMQGQAVGSNPAGASRTHVFGDEDKKMRVEEFIENVADGVFRALRGSRQWLVLAMVGYEAAIFRKVSEYPYIAQETITGNPDRTTARELHRAALAIVQALTRKEHLAGVGDGGLASQHGKSRS
jgi:hypothetical protein